MIQYLMERGPQALRVFSIHTTLPLHVAAWAEAPVEVVQLLANAYPRALKVADDEGHTPLHCACEAGATLEVVLFLALKRPASLRERNDAGYLPLHLCAIHCSLAVTRVAMAEWQEFLKNFNVVKLDYSGVNLKTVMQWYDRVTPPFREGWRARLAWWRN